MDILSCSTSLLTCLSLQCTAQVKLCVLLPDITLTNCWKVRAELVLEYLGMSGSLSHHRTGPGVTFLIISILN